MTTEHICGKCSESFSTTQGLSAHKATHSYEYEDADTLREMYHTKGMSTLEIADEFGVDTSTIRKYMIEGGVERRKAYNDPTHPPRHYFDERGLTVGDSYEKIQVYYNGERLTVYIHRLIAYAHGMLDFEGLCDPMVDVHHKSRHGLDNRPDNLEVKSRSEHWEDHLEERYGSGGWRDKNILKKLLEETTQKEAAEILGCSKRTIYVWKNKHDLE